MLLILLPGMQGCTSRRRQSEAPAGLTVEVSPPAGSCAETAALTIEFGHDIGTAKLAALLSPFGMQGPASATVGKQSVSFHFNGPTLPIPATASVAGVVTLSTGQACPVAKTWSFEYMPIGVDDPLPPAAVLPAGSDEEFVYVYRETALRAAPGHDASELAVLPVGALLQVCAREGDWVQLTTSSPPDLPAFRDRSGRTPPSNISPGLSGWASAAALTRLVAPVCTGMAFAGDALRHELDVLYKGYPIFGFTITGETSEADLRYAEAIACISLLMVYSNPHTVPWETIDAETQEEFLRALDTYAQTALRVDRFPLLASIEECSEIDALLQESYELNQTLLELARPLTRAAATQRLEALVRRATGVPAKISDDASIAAVVDSWPERWAKLRNRLVDKLSDSICPYSPGE